MATSVATNLSSGAIAPHRSGSPSPSVPPVAALLREWVRNDERPLTSSSNRETGAYSTWAQWSGAANCDKITIDSDRVIDQNKFECNQEKAGKQHRAHVITSNLVHHFRNRFVRQQLHDGHYGYDWSAESPNGRDGSEADSLEAFDVDDGWAILPPSKNRAVAHPSATAPEAPSLQLMRERCSSEREHFVPERTELSINTESPGNKVRGLGFGRNFLAPRGSFRTTTTTTVCSSIDTSDSRSLCDGAMWLPEGEEFSDGNRSSLSLSLSALSERNRGLLSTEGSGDSFGTSKRPRNCLFKMRKNVVRQMKKWRAERKERFSKNENALKPVFVAGLSERSESRVLPSWLAGSQDANMALGQSQGKDSDCDSLGKRRRGRKTSTVLSDKENKIRTKSFSKRKKSSRRKDKPVDCAAKSKNDASGVVRTYAPGSFPKTYDVSAVVQPQNTQLPTLPNNAAMRDAPGAFHAYKTYGVSAVAQPAKTKLASLPSNAAMLGTPGAFHANAYYDTIRGKVLSYVTSTAPLLPPDTGKIIWSLSKAALSLSDRAHRARLNNLHPTSQNLQPMSGNSFKAGSAAFISRKIIETKAHPSLPRPAMLSPWSPSSQEHETSKSWSNKSSLSLYPPYVYALLNQGRLNNPESRQVMLFMFERFLRHVAASGLLQQCGAAEPAGNPPISSQSQISSQSSDLNSKCTANEGTPVNTEARPLETKDETYCRGDRNDENKKRIEEELVKEKKMKWRATEEFCRNTNLAPRKKKKRVRTSTDFEKGDKSSPSNHLREKKSSSFTEASDSTCVGKAASARSSISRNGKFTHVRKVVKVVVVGKDSTEKGKLATLLAEDPVGESTGAGTVVKDRLRSKRKGGGSTVDSALSGGICEQGRGLPLHGEKGMMDQSDEVRFNVWDTKGDFVNHATQELLFSNRAIYVLLWNMSSRNYEIGVHGTKEGQSIAPPTRARAASDDSYSEDETDHPDKYFEIEEARRRALCALERDIDESVIFWIDCVSRKAPESVILPVVSHDNLLSDGEAMRRCTIMCQRVLEHQRKVRNRGSQGRVTPHVILSTGVVCGVMRVRTETREGLGDLRRRIVRLSRSFAQSLLAEQVTDKSVCSSGESKGSVFRIVKGTLRSLRKRKLKLVTWDYFTSLLKNELSEPCGKDAFSRSLEEEVKDALRYAMEGGEICLLGEESNEDLLIVLDRRWLLLALSCLQVKRLRNRNLRDISSPRDDCDGIFRRAHSNCPLVTEDEIRTTWRDNNVIRAAMSLASGGTSSGNDNETSIFERLLRTLVRAKILLPVDVCSESAVVTKPKIFFLPSPMRHATCSQRLHVHTLGGWTYKCSEAWKTALCNSFNFTDNTPTDIIMQHLMVDILKAIYMLASSGAVSGQSLSGGTSLPSCSIRVHEMLCWRSSFYLKLGTVGGPYCERGENVVEILIHLVDGESPMCVAADSTFLGVRRLLVSAKGQEGDGGRKIWDGGFSLVNDAVEKFLSESCSDELQPLLTDYQKECVCPTCLGCLEIGKASVFKWETIENAIRRCDGSITCFAGHVVDPRLVAGACARFGRRQSSCGSGEEYYRSLSTSSYDDDMSMSSTLSSSVSSTCNGIIVKDCLGSIVLVGLWDGKKVVKAGSGFIVDSKRGLIVTASHTLIDMTKGSEVYGQNYFGRTSGRAVIGLIPDSTTSFSSGGCDRASGGAVFRYFAEIVAKDVDTMDACVLKITTRLENDVGGNGDGCASQPEIPLFDRKMVKAQKLRALSVTQKFERLERVKLLGFNQGGEGLFEPGVYLNRIACCEEGYVCKLHKFDEEGMVSPFCDPGGGLNARGRVRSGFIPREEIVVRCPTVIGHSGGPFVNQCGQVIGILSRAEDARHTHQCYLVPASEFMNLVAKAKLRRPNPIEEFL